jgi:hypothetical protein
MRAISRIGLRRAVAGMKPETPGWFGLVAMKFLPEELSKQSFIIESVLRFAGTD